MTLMWSWRAIGESSRTRRSRRESEQPVGINFSQNSRRYIVLKLPFNPHALIVFHGSRLIPAHWLFFMGHGLHLRIDCFSWVTAYTRALIVFHGSRLIPAHWLFFMGHGLYPRIDCFSWVTAYTRALIVFHGSRLTPTHWLFFMGHGLYPRIDCFSLVTAYTNALFIFQ